MITIVIKAPAKLQAHLSVYDPNDLMKGSLAPARQLLVQGILSIEGQTNRIEQVDMPLVTLAALRNFLASVGANDKPKQRRLLLMALMQLDDEDESLIYKKPLQSLPLIASK